MIEFKPFPKMARYSRDCIITEKIDGTNAQIRIELHPQILEEAITSKDFGDAGIFSMFAGSRTRWLTTKNDNFGFARWVTEHAEELFALGEGSHYGEWWGNGIQRGYGLVNGDKRFSLFNVTRWEESRPACCGIVPILARGLFSENLVLEALENLRTHGSYAAPFMNPEGIVIYHEAAGVGFKKTLENDEKPKGQFN